MKNIIVEYGLYKDGKIIGARIGKRSRFVKEQMDVLIEATPWLDDDAPIYERVYNVWHEYKEKHKCKRCGGDVKWYHREYRDYCCNRCAQLSDEVKKKTIRTNEKRYGCHPSSRKEWKEMVEKTTMNKYGVKYAMQNKEINKKQRDTVSDKYGVDNVSKLDEIKEKKVNTQINNFGCIAIRLDATKEKIKKTNREKYGVDYYTQTKEYKEKSTATNMKKYGAKTHTCAHLTNMGDMNREFISRKFINNKGQLLLGKFTKYFNCSDAFVDKMRKECEWMPYSEKKYGKEEWMIADMVEGCKRNDRRLIGMELDVLDESNGLAIEYDGLLWHSYGKNKSSMLNNWDKRDSMVHVKKTDACEEKGINLLRILDSEWNNEVKKKVWESVINGKLGKNKRVFARKCEVVNVNSREERKFMDRNHLQGYASSSVRKGLIYKGELVAMMTFGKPRYDKEAKWELIRFCNVLGVNVVGGASRLLAAFRRKNEGNIISYANRRWSNGKLYEVLGFELVGTTRPNYWYVDKRNELHNRSKFMKHKLEDKLYVFDEDKSEIENMVNNGYRVYYDCGNYKYLLS